MTGLPCAEADWPRFSELLEAALDVPESAQADWLAALGSEDAHLKTGLARVLGHASAHNTAELLQMPRLRDTEFSSGERIGPYCLESLLGKGGMGEVWRASRSDDGPHREIALKLPHPAFLGGPFQRRFARERDVLAALCHPHIAQLYDAGSSADGHPYLALELVAGVPVTVYCREQKVALARRVVLVTKILDGLSYAHQRLIVHRDIKPSNVLVTQDGRVKLLDFGIAKLLGPEDGQEAALTQVARLATPGYAAPEQLSGGTITVATDIFGVGILLYELCTGHLPFPHGGPEPDAMAPLASSRADASASGSPEGPRLAGLLRGDLDAVIAKALTIDPAGRYPSAEAFGADLDRWRRGLPVQARRIGWVTRTVKFCRRNRLGVALGAVLALSVAGGTAGVAWQAQRAAREAQRAELESAHRAQEARRATAIKDFLIGLFRTIDPRGGGKPGHEMTARELLDTGADRATSAFSKDPDTAIDLLETLGSIYDALDDFPRARALWLKRLEVAKASLGPTDWRVMQDGLDLAASESEAMDYAGAQALLDAIHPVVLHAFGPGSPQHAYWLTERAKALRAAPDGRAEAVANLEQAVAIFASHQLDDAASNEFVDALELLSFRQFDADQFSLSLSTLRRMRALALRVAPGNAMHDIGYLDAEGLRLERLGDVASAEADFVAEQARAQKLLGKSHFWYRSALAKRIVLAALSGDRQKTAMLLRQAEPGLPGSPDSVDRARAMALVAEGDGLAAVPVLEAWLANAARGTRDAINVWRAESLLGEAYNQAGNRDKARRWLQQARNDWHSHGLPGQVSSLAAQQQWGQFLLDSGDTAAARAEFLDVLAQSQGVPSAPAARAAAGLAQAALAIGDLKSADESSTAALKNLDATTVEYDVRIRIEVWDARAEVLLALGRTAEARMLAERAADTADAEYAPGTTPAMRAHHLLTRIAALH